MMGVPRLEFWASHWSQVFVRPARLYDTRLLEVPSKTLKDHRKNGRNYGRPRDASPAKYPMKR